MCTLTMEGPTRARVKLSEDDDFDVYIQIAYGRPSKLWRGTSESDKAIYAIDCWIMYPDKCQNIWIGPREGTSDDVLEAIAEQLDDDLSPEQQACLRKAMRTVRIPATPASTNEEE